MKAIVISRPGGIDVLEMHELPKPEPKPGEVLVRIQAAGLNRSDIYSRKGVYGNMEGNEIPGLEIAGIVEAIGAGVSRWKNGDHVCALIAGGGYAEYIAVDERLCLPVPSGFSFEEAAALPEAIFTIWFTVFKQAAIQSGEHFLVHGGASGIGVMAIQLVTAFGGKVYITAGTEEKCRFCMKLGAIKAVNYKTQDFEADLKDEGIDVILDMVGGDYTQKNLRLLRNKGRLCFINAMNGAQSNINIAEIMRKNLVITGSMLKPQPLEVKAALAAEIEQKVWPLIIAGKIKPVIYKVFSLEKAAAAQQLMESGEHIGKIILKPH
jgi:putative PIG3 family NAD(P)H quinone oxidoreductase